MLLIHKHFSMIFVLLLLVVVLAPMHTAAQSNQTVRVSFPKVTLAKGERIIGFTFQVKNGTVNNIGGIKRDWSLSLDNSLSWWIKVSGFNHHGAGALDSINELPMLTVTPDEGEEKVKFKVTGMIKTTIDFRRNRQRIFKMSEMGVEAVTEQGSGERRGGS